MENTRKPPRLEGTSYPLSARSGRPNAVCAWRWNDACHASLVGLIVLFATPFTGYIAPPPPSQLDIANLSIECQVSQRVVHDVCHGVRRVLFSVVGICFARSDQPYYALVRKQMYPAKVSD